MDDLTIDDFPPDRLAAMVHWRNDPTVNQYLRQGIRTLAAVQEWYAQYFSRAENKLFAVYADNSDHPAFTVYHLHRVYAVIQGGNIASRRCFEKVGFQHEGTWRDARYVNGAWIDLHYYAVLEPEWRT